MNNKSMTNDIQSRADIRAIVELFYDLSFEDERLGDIFKNIAPLKLETHIPLVVDFWEGILFDVFTYKGNVTEAHFSVNGLTPLTKADFDLWLSYWIKAIDTLFKGELAEKMKFRATSIANIMSYKMDYINQHK
jgi:hemoglobin